MGLVALWLEIGLSAVSVISENITPPVYLIYLFIYLKKVASHLSLKFARLRVRRTSKQTKIASG